MEENTKKDENIQNNTEETTNTEINELLSDDVESIEEEEEIEIVDPQLDINENTRPKAKKSHPILYASGVGLLAFGCAFGGTYLSNNIFPLKTVVYHSDATVVPLNSNNQLSIQEIASKNLNSVVEIQTENVTEFVNQQYVMQGAGSGVICTTDGYIITNNHVIDGTNNIKVKLHNGEVYEATLIGRDIKTDLAIIKIDADNLLPVTFADSDKINVGDTVLAIGNPLGELGGSVTDGIVSAVNRNVMIQNQRMNLIQTNAQVSPGNSGGGLFDSNGNLIGIVVAKSIGDNVEGIGFAIPANTVSDIIDEIITHGYVTSRPTIGVYVREIAANNQDIKPGLYVTGLIEESAALKAGIVENDRIVSIDNNEISTFDDLSNYLSNKQIGDQVEIQVSRDGQLINVSLILQNSVKQ